MKSPLKKSDYESLITQCMEEYDHAIEYRQKREAEWRLIDELYYGKKKKSLVSRANVHIPIMQGTIDTFLSKIDDEPYLIYNPIEEGDQQAAEFLKALVRRQMIKDDWGLVELLGKKEAALYGRATFKKFSERKNKKFVDHFDYVDTLDFYIDPMAGGLDPMRKALYMGHDNLIKTIHDLESNPSYDQAAVKRLKASMKRMDADTEADDKYGSKQARRQSLNLSQAVLFSQDSLKFTEHYTTFRGERYYVLFSYEHKEAVVAVPLTSRFKSDEFPFLSWAVFPRANEFYTPGVGELVKEYNMVKNIITSQVLDNTAYRNYGMKAYDSTKITNANFLKPKPGGTIPVQGDPSSAIKELTFPDVTPALQVLTSLGNDFAQETGVTQQAKGMPHTKRMSATEFAGLIEEVADRFFTSNRTYRHALKRLGYLFLLGVQENMTSNERVRILGATGVEDITMSAADITGEFDIEISTGATEENASQIDRDRFMTFAKDNRENPNINQRFVDEKQARMLGLKDYEVERLLNPQGDGDWKTLAEAAHENELMLKKEIPLNRSATMAHVQKHLDYVRTTEELTDAQRARILSHANNELQIAVENEELTVSKMLEKERQQIPLMAMQQMQAAGPGTGASAPAQGAAPLMPPLQGMAPVQLPGAQAPLEPEQVRQAAIAQAPQPAGAEIGLV